MANTEKETILILLLTEAIRRLSKNGKNPIHITNTQIKRNLNNGLEVDYSKSDSDKFILKITSHAVSELAHDDSNIIHAGELVEAGTDEKE